MVIGSILPTALWSDDLLINLKQAGYSFELQCNSFGEFVERYNTESGIDIIITHIPNSDQFSQIGKLKKLIQGVKIIVIAEEVLHEHFEASLGNGADGYFIYLDDLTMLYYALEHTLNGGMYIAPQVSHFFIEYIERQQLNSVDKFNARDLFLQYQLSDREIEIARLLVQDQSYAAIADQLCLSINTIRNHVKHLYKKLGVHSKNDLQEMFSD